MTLFPCKGIGRLFVFGATMRTNEQIYHQVTKRIRQIEQGNVRVLHHFMPHYKNRTFIVDCWCGVSFASAYIDRHDLEDFISWINEHAACVAKGQP